MKFLSNSLLLRYYLLITALASAIAFYNLAFIPSDSRNAIFAGYSLSRLLLLICLAVPFLVTGAVFVVICFSPTYLNRLTLLVDNFLESKGRRFFNISSALLVLFSVIFLLMPPGGFREFAAASGRLAPLVYFGGFLGGQSLLGQFLWREQKVYFENLRQWKSLFVLTGLIFMFVVALSAWVSWSGIGLKPEINGWHTPGTPILFPQLIAAFFLSLLFFIFKNQIEIRYMNLWKDGKPPLKFDTVIFLVLWFTAFLIWQAEPMRRQSYFTPAPTPPNFEYYPYSDAGLYDTTSQSILIGEGRNVTMVLRPLYVFFLVILHMIGGQNYDVILTLQVLCLAVMPALVFMIVSLLGSQSAGVLAAILVIVRERNSIALTNIIEVSHSKLLMSDLPTMAFMLLFVYALMNWLRKNDGNYHLGIVSGASFGLIVLVRSQAQLLLPILLLGIIFTGGFQWRKAVQRTAIFILGLLIVVSPWVFRNYQVSGKPVVENTEFYTRIFAGGYSEPTDAVDRLPGESLDEYNQRIKSQIVRYIFNHPLEITRIYTTYFIHNEISSVIYLPMSLELYDLRSYVDHLSFWGDPFINLANGYGVMFFFTLGLITLGIAAAFQRLKFLGIFPMLIHFAYNLSVVVARVSGWRFILPVDWIFLVYYCIGMATLIGITGSVISNRIFILDDVHKPVENEYINFPFVQRKTSLAFVGFLIIGLSLPLVELTMPVRYPALTDAELIKTHATNCLQLDRGECIPVSALKNFLETQAGATVIYGRALYPSYYEQGKYWGDNNPFSLRVRKLNRLQFTFIGSENSLVFIQLDLPPPYFPNASDVFIIGCREAADVRALAIKVNEQTPLITTSSWQGLTCPVQ